MLMALEKFHDRVDRDVIWSAIEMYGVNKGLINNIKSLYSESEACIIVQAGEWLILRKVGQHEKCVMYFWLLNVVLDGLKVEVRKRLDTIGDSLWDARHGWKWRVD